MDTSGTFQPVPTAELDDDEKTLPEIVYISSNHDLEADNCKNNYFEWKDVNVTIEEKQILHNVSGRVQSGELLGILGGSGAGKTTILNAISGRLLSKKPISSMCPINKCKSKGTEVSGTVAYKGNEFKLGSTDSIKYISAYVMQNDILCPTAKCKEALLFSSKLRSDKNESSQLKFIDHVIKSLKLEDCQNTKIGNDAIRGMSGGERKRTSVGCELVTNPSLIFLDEPTSGLDSFTALKTLNILKNLTQKENKQVIATIHQPSSDIFNMIDILLLLSKGHVVYFGPSKNVLQYFDKLGFECPKYSNIADYVVKEVQQHSKLFIESWQKYSKEYIDLDFNKYNTLIPTQKQTSSFCMQIVEIIKREFQILIRDPRPSKIRLVQTIVFAIFIAILYYQLPYTSDGARDRMAAFISTLIVFPQQRLLFERERDNNMYYTTTYILTKFLVLIPEQAIFTLIYVVILYWMIGMDSNFGEVYIAILLCVMCVASLGMIIGCFAQNTAEAVQLMPVIFIPMLLFANYLVSLDQIPVWLRWIQWINPFKYVVDCLSITEFEDQLHSYECHIESIGECSEEICEYKYNGNAYLEQIDAGFFGVGGFKGYIESAYLDWLMLFILLCSFRCLSWGILVARNGI